MCDMRDREALLTALPKIEYNQEKSLATSHLIWKALENSFEGDTHSKKLRLKSQICSFKDAKIMEDESVRIFVGRILEKSLQILDLKEEPKKMMRLYGRY